MDGGDTTRYRHYGS